MPYGFALPAGGLERKTSVGQSRINRIAVFRDPGSASAFGGRLRPCGPDAKHNYTSLWPMAVPFQRLCLSDGLKPDLTVRAPPFLGLRASYARPPDGSAGLWPCRIKRYAQQTALSGSPATRSI